jgi:hypothetical protein
MTDYRTVLERDLARVGPAPFGFDDVARRRDRKRRNQRIAAGVVGIAVFVAAVWIVTSVGSLDRSETSVVPGGNVTGPTETGPTETRPTETGPIETGPTVAPNPDVESSNALPPEGATPSTPKSGELVLQLDFNVWVYADGRLISRLYDQDALGPYSGLVEQHLTPEGVEFLRSNVLSTGLFDRDLKFLGGGGSFSIQVRDGDRLVFVSLSPLRTAWPDLDSVEATPQQVTALESLYALLTDPTLWPAGVWADQQIRAYVPTSYSVCSWGFPQVEPSRVLALLPESARDLLGPGYMKTDGSKSRVDCTQMTTEEARALAGILDAASGVALFPGWLRYSLEDPEVPGSLILIGFEPVLPHGEATPMGGG